MTHAVWELRQYTLHPGKRDALIELFEREFVTGQAACGIDVIGTFLDLDAPDRFVWIRSFYDHLQRDVALRAFYGGPVWRAHRTAANATMIDSDDVLQLRPLGAPDLRPGRGPLHAVIRAAPATIHAGPGVFARFETDPSPNGFPALPVRSGSYTVALGRGAAPAGALRLAPTKTSKLR